MRKSSAVIIFFLVLTASGASMAGAKDTVVRDCIEIMASKKLIVAMVDRDYLPYIIRGKDGQLTGLSVELAQDIAKELGVSLEIVKADSFNEVVDKVAAGQADIGLPLSTTLSRSLQVDFTNAYRKYEVVLLLNRMKMAEVNLEAGMQHLDDLKKTTEPIGVIGRSAYEAGALKHFPNAEVKTYDRLQDLIRAAEKGEILFAGVNSGMSSAYLKDNPHLLIKLQPFTIKGRYSYIAMAVNLEADHLLSWLNTYLTLKGMTVDTTVK